MAGPLAAAGVAAAGSLLGGVLGGRQAENAANRAYSHKKQWALEGPGYIRKGAEDAGFNPLVFAGAQTYNPAAVAPGSSGMAQAAGAFSDAINTKHRNRRADTLQTLAQKNVEARLELDAAELADRKRAREMAHEIALSRLHTEKENARNRLRNAPAIAAMGPQKHTPDASGSADGINRRAGGRNFLRLWPFGELRIPRGVGFANDAEEIVGEPGNMAVGVSNIFETLLYNYNKLQRQKGGPMGGMNPHYGYDKDWIPPKKRK